MGVRDGLKTVAEGFKKMLSNAIKPRVRIGEFD